MIQIQYPFIDENGQSHEDLIKQHSDSGKYLLQVETGAIYDEAIDVFPCIYTYEEVGSQLENSIVNKE